jgi:3alpha(or 20beta)-hydroxysteroid dehydrogenase
MGLVDGKIAIVSGAGSGMGVAHVRALVAEGAKVLGFDLQPGEGPELMATLGEDRMLFLQGDVTKSADWARIVSQCEKRFGPPTVLVNNAGIFRPNRVESVTEEAYRQVIDVNQVGVYLGMQSVVEPMRRAGGGSIVNISSTAGLVSFEDNFAYTASKWAVRGMTRAAALELARDGIRVNTVCPSETETPMILGVDDPGTSTSAASFPFGRWAKPEEMANAVVFLASDRSSYMSGSDMVVDGAFTAT